MQTKHEQFHFDRRLATECARAFSLSTGLGCVVSDVAGVVVAEIGAGCASCKMCEASGQPPTGCIQAQNYGMTEAERFGGKYIYFCPMGLTCFVSPIVGAVTCSAKIIVGPFLMVERQDYIDCELKDYMHLSGDTLQAAVSALNDVPFVSPDRVNDLSILLFMSVGFMNNISSANRMLETQASESIQGQITSYIMQLKNEPTNKEPYPFETERALLKCISRAEKKEAQKLLNELFAHILISFGNDLNYAKARSYELLVLVSRTTIEDGADPERSLKLNQDYLQAIPGIASIDDLCLWLSGVINHFMDEQFGFIDAKHSNTIHRTVQYLQTHYTEKVTLENVSRVMYLSPAYFSRIFKQETGKTFNTYLNNIRITKAKEILHQTNSHLRLTDIALMVGFEDQSYFTKVFKRITGISPLKYRSNSQNIDSR